MAKVHKVTMYITDIGGDTNLEEIIECGLNEYDLYPKFINVDSSEDFEWDDNLEINKISCSKESYEKYLKRHNLYR